MAAMHFPRARRLHRQLAHWVLACFVLALGTAVAAPLVKPEAKTLLCTASGQWRMVSVESVADAQPDALSAAHAGLDCILCLGLDTVMPAPRPHTLEALPLAGGASALSAWQWIPTYVHPARPGQGPPSAIS